MTGRNAAPSASRPLYARARRRVAILAILFLYLLSAAAFTTAVPPWEAPDEPWHLAYAEALASGRLPTEADSYEFHQPPLYYLYVAAAIRRAGLARLPRALENPRYPLAADVYQHLAGDAAAPGLRLLRTATVWLGLLAVALTWAAARAAVPHDDRLANGAALVMASLPQFGFMNGVISNDPLVCLWGAVALAGTAALWRCARRGEWSWTAAGAVCAAMFLGLLTKLTILGLWPGMALATVAAGRRSGRERAGWLAAASLAAVVLLADAAFQRWWPAAHGALGGRLALVGPAAGLAPLHSWRDVATVLPMLARSSWAQFGWLNVAGPPWLTAMAAALVAASLWQLARHWRRLDEGGRWLTATAIVCSLGTAAAGILNLRVDLQPQGRLLFGALPAAAVLVSAGSVLAAPRRRWPPILSGLAAAGALTTVQSLAWRFPQVYGADGKPPLAIAAGTVGSFDELSPLAVEGTSLVHGVFGRPQPGWRRIELPISGLGTGMGVAITATQGSRTLAAVRTVVTQPESPASWVGIDLATAPGSALDQSPLALEIRVMAAGNGASPSDAAPDRAAKAARAIYWTTSNAAAASTRLVVDGRDAGGAAALVYGDR